MLAEKVLFVTGKGMIHLSPSPFLLIGCNRGVLAVNGTERSGVTQ